MSAVKQCSENETSYGPNEMVQQGTTYSTNNGSIAANG